MPYVLFIRTRVVNDREVKTFMKTASGAKYPIKSYGDLPLIFRYGRDEVPPLLLDVCIYLVSATTFSL